MSQHYSIIVDDRESSAAVADALRQDPRTTVRIQRLSVGDYLVDQALLFERKTLMDLTASIKDGRIFRQGLRLANASAQGILILEGRSHDLSQSRMRREAIQGALVTLSLGFGIPLLRSADPEETARLILLAARQGRTRARGALPRPGSRPRTKSRVQSHVLQGLPGVGPERAKRLIERFGTVEAVIAAPVSELAAVPGIGTGTATAIRWAVEEAPLAYAEASIQSRNVQTRSDG
ncbi:MAG: ERCC4 domain-containing protein [Thiohalocapsa sp.]